MYVPSGAGPPQRIYVLDPQTGGMDWREKSVTLGSVKKERFDTHLAHVTVSETRITVAYKDVEDWKRIRREVGTSILLEEVAVEDVRDVDTSEEHLYYPHIDLTVATEDGTEEKRIYFMEDEEDDLHACQNAITRFWNAQRQRGAPHRDSYTYGGEDVAGGEDDVEAARDDGEAGAEPDTGAAEDEAEAAEEVEEPAEMEEVELTAALKRQNSLTHRISQGLRNEAAHFKRMLTGGGAAEDEAGEREEEDEKPDTEDEAEGQDEEAEKTGLMEKISDEYRAEIDRFRHIGEDGQPKEDEGEEDGEDEDASSAADEDVNGVTGQ